MVDKQSLETQLEAQGQSHVLRFWDELTVAERSSLSAQILAIDFAQLQQLLSQEEQEESWRELASRAASPPAITLSGRTDASDEEAYRVGAGAIAGGKVAMILTAGGQGSRLGFEHPKGMFPSGPLSGRALYQIIIEHVAARGRQMSARIPLFVMTSPPTHRESSDYLESNQFFGYDPSDFSIFCQGVMPAVDGDGKLLLASRSELFVSPDGHGGMLRAFESSGALDSLAARGIEHVFYGQIDNPLIQVCDPTLLGYHILASSEMTTQVVRKSSALQRVGNVVSVDDQVQIIEYRDLPEEFARQTNDDGGLKLWAGSIAVHVFTAEFLRRTSHQADALPFHRANKIVPTIDAAGEQVVPTSPNAIKFERFIFDLLPWAKNAIVCEVDPAEGFCAVKNAAPAESETPEHVMAAIVALHKSWLQRAGVDVADEIDIEICPFFAVDHRELAAKIDSGFRLTESTFIK